MPLWRSRFDEESGMLALELRDGEALTTAFSVYKLPEGKPVIEPLSFQEGWWLTLIDIGCGFMVLQEYTDAENPQSVQTFFQQISQEHSSPLLEGYTHLGFWQGQSFGSRLLEGGQELMYYRVDCFDGSTQELTSKEAKEIIPHLQNLEKALNFPNLYAEGSESFTTVRQFMLECYQLSCVLQVEYLEIGDKIIVSYFIRENEQLKNELMVLKTDGSLEEKFVLTANASGTVSDTFWVYKNQLILLTDDKTILGYELI